MMIPNFKITQIFEITSRNMLVLTGNLLVDSIENNSFLIDVENNIRIKINSIEMVNSKDMSGLIALTFMDIEKHQLDFLRTLKKDSVVLVK